jgi:acyl-CoA synthetase (AMP-forming)/AMP-acid ligase II
MTGSGSCGLPVAFRRLRIAGPEGREVPAGATGELWIGGAGLMHGYHRRPDATADTLRDGWLRTGDLVRRDADGFHHVLGRIKDVIRRSGENISASEIETVLTGLPEIVEAAAIGVPDELRGEEVKVCLVLQPGLGPSDLPPQRVLAHCRARLARFKLPRFIAYLPELPKTPSGKVAKTALRPAGANLRLGTYDTTDALWR